MKQLSVLVLLISSIHIFGTRCPDSAPYISGDAFRNIANHIYDETSTTLTASEVQHGDIVFVNLSYLEPFFDTIHPNIQHPYILISHNNDDAAPGKFRHLLDDPRIFAWFTQNADYTDHPKLTVIPIGLKNKRCDDAREHDVHMKAGEEKIGSIARKHLLYVNFNVFTAPAVRQPVYDYFIKVPFCTWFSNRIYSDFVDDLLASKYVLSPHGNGLDCYRTWEALYMGCIPVVKTSTLDPLYENLPVLIVNEWSDLSVEFLERAYHAMKQKEYQYKKLYFPYWYEKIMQVQVACRG